MFHACLRRTKDCPVYFLYVLQAAGCVLSSGIIQILPSENQLPSYISLQERNSAARLQAGEATVWWENYLDD